MALRISFSIATNQWWLVKFAFGSLLGGTPRSENAPLLGERLLCFGIGLLMSPPSRFAPRQVFQAGTRSSGATDPNGISGRRFLPMGTIPGLLKSTSTQPKLSTARRISASTSERFVTSVANPMTLPPAAVIFEPLRGSGSAPRSHFFFPLSAGRRSFRSASSENGF